MPLLVDGLRVRLPQSVGELVRAHPSLEVSGFQAGASGPVRGDLPGGAGSAYPAAAAALMLPLASLNLAHAEPGPGCPVLFSLRDPQTFYLLQTLRASVEVPVL